ncbi:MAG: energy transducer TonB, partial [Acidobacteria bacterium]|nr:energy transducer TonB [Candidatus Polarisedimenticola svalbardensis]
PVDLPNGETVTLMHPGVDGVEAPYAVRSRIVAPRYPSRADRFPGGSSVTVAAMILADGSLGQLEVLGASHPDMGYEEAATDAVSRWTSKSCSIRQARSS